MGYRGTKERTTTINVDGWSVARDHEVHLQGLDPQRLAGQHLFVALHVDRMEPEDQYAFARAMLRWSTRLEAAAIAEMDKAAQRPLF